MNEREKNLHGSNLGSALVSIRHRLINGHGFHLESNDKSYFFCVFLWKIKNELIKITKYNNKKHIISLLSRQIIIKLY